MDTLAIRVESIGQIPGRLHTQRGESLCEVAVEQIAQITSEVFELLRASSFPLHVAGGDREIVSMYGGAEPRDRPEGGVATERIGRRRWGFSRCRCAGRLSRRRSADAEQPHADNDRKMMATADVKHMPYFIQHEAYHHAAISPWRNHRVSSCRRMRGSPVRRCGSRRTSLSRAVSGSIGSRRQQVPSVRRTTRQRTP